MQRSVPHGQASLYLADGVSFLNQEDAVFQAMLDGWTMQQRGGRNLKEKTVKNAVRAVERFQAFTNEWPWQWSASSLDEWMMHLVSVKKLAPSTIRGLQLSIGSFCDYVCSPHYGWAGECEGRFGTHPVQICHDWNTLPHLQVSEGKPGRRPLTRVELQELLDYADAEVDRCLESGRKGALPAYRDATLLKVVYAWGLRANEAVQLDVTDFYRNPPAPEFGRYGILQVRHGKSSRGGVPKQRSVVSLRMWAVEAVSDYIENVRPLMQEGKSNALWFSERGTRLRDRELRERFASYRDAIGLDRVLTPHALRHSYVTHLTEEGVDTKFIQEQVGHAYQSTTAIYTAVSGDFANKMMREALNMSLETRIDEEGNVL
ncbi:tyrosine-type recombinase/integrase [Arthrobacter sp. A2-55]|uniref:tyrosine-type recombinase/integrase n=1 Tax=Arthrobacter sp. A2-55 TaxID=2897337 RepID=UPI0021CD6B6E|nr:tyrosine-type recombinase/integrase [Arthrobacter sp. A2-55]MCU6479696.1 tyrosine-type recombinase/integrase [Arthrobacter sp. A2-55]